jgi:hypothetical protein
VLGSVLNLIASVIAWLRGTDLIVDCGSSGHQSPGAGACTYCLIYLLCRHLSTEQRMLLFAELSRLYEVGRGGDRKSEKIKEAKSASLIPKESVLEKTAREVGVSPRTMLLIKYVLHISYSFSQRQRLCGSTQCPEPHYYKHCLALHSRSQPG